MQKTFPLTVAGKADARVLDSIKHEVRKYVKRERRKAVPPEFEQWDFACKVGNTQVTAESKSLRDVGSAIDAVAAAGARVVYLEIMAVPIRRTALAKSTSVSPLADDQTVNSANSAPAGS